MSRRGFALISVLWVLATLSAVVGASLALVQTENAAGQNRIALTRGAWAREACLEILLGRYATDAATGSIDSVDLGRGTWCRAVVSNPAAKLDLNRAAADALGILIGNDTLVDAVLDWRDADDITRPFGAERVWYEASHRRRPRNAPFADVGELRLVKGFDSARVSRLEQYLSTEGIGQIDINAAAPEVLATLPGFVPETEAAVLFRRRSGARIENADQLLALLPASARARLLERYQEFTRVAVYAAPQFVVTIEGGVRGLAPVSRAWVTLVPAAGRMAVVRRRSE